MMASTHVSTGDSTGKTVYIPYISDHSRMMQAVLEHLGVRAEALPPPDDVSAKIGLDLVLGKECAPCLITVGDMIRRAKAPDFDPARAVMLMPTAPGPCRFGQYSVLQRRLLDEHGLAEVELASPTSGNSYQGLGDHPVRLRRLAWDGAVALDLLQQLLHRFRPYERDKGAADALYAAGLERILDAVRAGGGKPLQQALARCGNQFAALPLTDQEPKPLIGLVGEIYVRFNAYANQDIIRRIEELGGEVMLASMMEWLYLTTYNPGYYAKRKGRYKTYTVMKLTETYQRYREHALTRSAAHLLRHAYERPTGELVSLVRPYLAPEIQTEAVLTLAKAIELAHLGASGILAVMPFSCMPGLVTAAIAPRVRSDLDNIPWLDLSFDLQKATNIQTRLEAFIYQAQHFQRRRA
jgi:predicted nucleotide-binding protein (sugar kinase/HSP70/actin superfamily)